MKRGLLLLLVSFAAASIGCSKTAIITKADGRVLKGEVLRSDSEQVFLKTELGFEQTATHSHVAEIDHPGNVHATIGTILALGGLALIISAPSLCGFEDDFCWELGGGYMLGTGGVVFLSAAPVAIWGWVVWDRSKRRSFFGCEARGGYCKRNEGRGCRQGYRESSDCPGCIIMCCLPVEDETEDAPADDRSPSENAPPSDEGPSPGDQFSIRFLGITPLMDSDREVKGLTLGFQF